MSYLVNPYKVTPTADPFGFTSDFGNNSDGWTLGSAFSLDTANARINFTALTTSGGILSYEDFNTGTGSWELKLTQYLAFTDSSSRWGFGLNDGSVSANARGTMWAETNTAWDEWQTHVCGCAVCNSQAYGSLTPAGTYYLLMKRDITIEDGTTCVWYPTEADRTNGTNGIGMTSPNSAETTGCSGMNFFCVTSSDNSGNGASGWVKDISLAEWTP